MACSLHQEDVCLSRCYTAARQQEHERGCSCPLSLVACVLNVVDRKEACDLLCWLQAMQVIGSRALGKALLALQSIFSVRFKALHCHMHCCCWQYHTCHYAILRPQTQQGRMFMSADGQLVEVQLSLSRIEAMVPLVALIPG